MEIPKIAATAKTIVVIIPVWRRIRTASCKVLAGYRNGAQRLTPLQLLRNKV